MRRIALLTALTLTLAGGSAAIAATDASAPTATPDPYLGAWRLNIDGADAGPIMNLDGCSVRAAIVTAQDGKRPAAPGYQPCTFDIGLGGRPNLYAWLDDALRGKEKLHRLLLNGVGGKGSAVLELTNASLASLTLPKVNRASLDGVFLKVAVRSERIRRVPPPGPIAAGPAYGFAPSSLAVTLGDAPVDVAAV